ncbi:hypothetical protein [Daejeonella oryzae]|uniref:hypothetical protein n=1 Tax=Daejeonella oryzae TaxID=1122943 RepID=UPI000479F6FC|nr:hypothetical protein [Daejeonella oryzae]
MTYFSGMRTTLRFFAILDAGSIILLSPQIYSILSNLGSFPPGNLSRIKLILLLFVFILLFFSSAGLFLMKKFGLISYYIQFPIRLIVWVFSFGFLTFISQYFSNPLIFDWLFRIAIILEFFRLYFTGKIHLKYFKMAR